MGKYKEFDSKIFEITKIKIGFSLTDGQQSELLKVLEEVETAHRAGQLSDAERYKLLCAMTDCGLELPPAHAEQAADRTELEKRLAEYLQSKEFQWDIGALVNDYQSQELPVPPEEQLREEAAAEARKCLETVLICEAKGHLWEEIGADPENGISEMACLRCGKTGTIRW